MNGYPCSEEEAVRQLGDAIGYGRVMQLCEKIWNEKQPGGAHSTGPCVALLVPCPHEAGQQAGDCDWCCGSGRITERVLKALQSSTGMIASAPDLLKALEAARGYIQGKFTNVPRPLRGKSREDELLRMIDAALAKEKGGAT